MLLGSLDKTEGNVWFEVSFGSETGTIGLY